jgi:DNA-binding winged helix-turn-helix (wHTH) protein/TolB-like protein
MPSARFRFGLFSFDAATQELRREETLVRLQAQPAQVLACLIERAGKVVSREELRNAVWGDGTFVDFDRGLNFCLTQIRSALGDDPANPTYIRTLPKRGYQFIAPVERIPGPAVGIQEATVPESQAQESKIPESATQEVKVQRTPAGHHFGKRAVLLASAVVACAALTFAAKAWFRSGHGLSSPPTVAVLRFDNQTADAGMTLFSDALTDNVVEQLTSQSNGRFSVIGNAHILRLPRDQRDLNAIGASLHASYVVLGQVQAHGDQTRILAHLIRLPDQKHVWVARMDRALSDGPGLDGQRQDRLSIQSEVAQKIAAELSPRVAADANRNASQAAASH